MRQMFQDYVKFLYGYEQRISLADCTRTIAKQIIDVMFEWIFTNGIPLNYKTSEMMKEDKIISIGQLSLDIVSYVANLIQT